MILKQRYKKIKNYLLLCYSHNFKIFINVHYFVNYMLFLYIHTYIHFYLKFYRYINFYDWIANQK